MFGIITLMDSLLLFKGNSRVSAMVADLPTQLLRISVIAIRTLNNLANLDLRLFQSVINGSSDGSKTKAVVNDDNKMMGAPSVLQTEFYHLVTFWLSFCLRQPSVSHSERILTTTLLHELILLLGYFLLENNKNKPLVRLGQYPVILQQLLMLPFPYFSNATYVTMDER
jgi:hypothetical protein